MDKFESWVVRAVGARNKPVSCTSVKRELLYPRYKARFSDKDLKSLCALRISKVHKTTNGDGCSRSHEGLLRRPVPDLTRRSHPTQSLS